MRIEQFTSLVNRCRLLQETIRLWNAGIRARRWVVKRTHSWMNRFRRIALRWTMKVRNYLGFVHLICAYITYKQAGLLDSF
jgi:putative transposase